MLLQQDLSSIESGQAGRRSGWHSAPLPQARVEQFHATAGSTSSSKHGTMAARLRFSSPRSGFGRSFMRIIRSRVGHLEVLEGLRLRPPQIRLAPKGRTLCSVR
jgi:hypothetical protein